MLQIVSEWKSTPEDSDLSKERTGAESWRACCDLANKRIEQAFKLLHEPAISEKLGSNPETLLTNANEAFSFLTEFQTGFSHITNLSGEFNSLVDCLNNFKGNENNKELLTQLRNSVRQCRELLINIEADLKDVPYPYEHGGQNISCAQYAVPAIPRATEKLEIAQASDWALQKLTSVYLRSLSDILFVEELVAKAANLEPMPQLPKKND